MITRYRPLFQIWKKELMVAGRDRRLVIALGAIVLLYSGALALGFAQHQQAYAEFDVARRAARQEWLEQGVRNPHDAGHWGTFLFKAPHALGIVDRGAADYMGDWIRLETHVQHDPQHRRAKEATGFFRLGGFTPLMVVSLLLPLVLLIATHASVTGEDEGGTSALVRATGIRARTLAAGKLFGAMTFAFLWFVPLLVASVVVVHTALGTTRDSMLSALAISVVTAVYCIVFVGIGVSISALCRTSRQSLAVGFGVWAALCVVVPRLAASIAEAQAPAPSAFEFKQALEEHRQNKWSIPYRARGNFLALYNAITERAMREQGVKSADSLRVDPFGLAIEETEEEGQRAYDASFRVVLQRFERQNALYRWFALLSPQIALQATTAALSRTDLASHLEFIRGAETYRRAFMKSINMDIAYNGMTAQRAASGNSYIRTLERGPEFWATFPEFRPSERTTSAVLASTAPEIAILCAWGLGMFAATTVAMRRRWGR